MFISLKTETATTEMINSATAIRLFISLKTETATTRHYITRLTQTLFISLKTETATTKFLQLSVFVLLPLFFLLKKSDIILFSL